MKVLTSLLVITMLISITACGPYEAPKKDQPIEYSGGE